jgi:hypothetical protein
MNTTPLQRQNEAGIHEETKIRKAKRKDLPLDSRARRSSQGCLGGWRPARRSPGDQAAATYLVLVFDQKARDRPFVVPSESTPMVRWGRQPLAYVHRQ